MTQLEFDFDDQSTENGILRNIKFDLLEFGIGKDKSIVTTEWLMKRWRINRSRVRNIINTIRNDITFEHLVATGQRVEVGKKIGYYYIPLKNESDSANDLLIKRFETATNTILAKSPDPKTIRTLFKIVYEAKKKASKVIDGQRTFTEEGYLRTVHTSVKEKHSL